jgi:D-amino-acid oxidase
VASSPAPGAGVLAGRSAVVVGSGVTGLTAALRLAEAGSRVTVVSTTAFPMVSTTACAFWLPAWASGETAEMLGGAVERSVVEPSWHAYDTLRRHEGAAAGLRSVTNKEYLEAGQSDPPTWLQEILAPSSIRPTELECEGRSYSRVWTFDSVVVDMKVHLDWLQKRAIDAGVTFGERLLTSLDEVADGRTADVVVNCTGLGARSLVGDTDVRPVRGLLVPFEVDPERLASLKAVAINEYYLIPRLRDVVVGGLIREEADPDTVEATPSSEDEELLMSKLGTLSRMASAGRPTALRRTGPASVGLRPHRRGGYRLETERSWPVPVVHNYGHGGSGVTLAWGCADRVVELAAAEFVGSR